jgi:multidrug efflux system outer membrane protein
VRYENGASDFLQVLDAERTLLESEDRLARSRTEAATSLIAVYKALGGVGRRQLAPIEDVPAVDPVVKYRP